MPNHEAYLRAGAALRMGIAATNEGRHREAIDLLRTAVSSHPQCARSHANLAVALERRAFETKTTAERQALLEEAVAESMEAVWLRPKFVEAVSNLGLMLENLGRVVEAERCYARVIALAPRSAEAAWSRAGALIKLERWSEAAEWYGQALKLKPDMDSAESNMVSALSSAGRNAEALYVLYGALKRDPAVALIWSNAGCILRKLGRYQAALECFEHALAINPDTPPAAWGRSLCLLALGRLENGWAAYGWGLKSGERQPARPFKQPVWDGSALEGKTLLVWMEQGLGDHINFAGMLPDLERAGAHLVVECEHRLVSLFQQSFPMVEVVPQTDPPQPRLLAPDIDLQIPSGSLPHFLRPNIDRFPVAVQIFAHVAPISGGPPPIQTPHPRYVTGGYLKANPSYAAIWADRLHKLGAGPKVGVSWRSLKTAGTRAMDCMSLSQWGPILSIPGTHWINLQPGWRDEELAEVGDRFDCRLHMWQGLDLKDDQDEQAALISNLDLVVSAFTVTAQLAGALGVPCWVLAHAGNRSWFELGTDHCPWHPSIRIFPCGALEAWDESIGRLAVELRRRYGL